jgi:RNA polymerase sigma-70 factor, ECF subfamily
VALKEIFMTHHESLCRVAFRIIPDKEKAKDIVQDVFLKLWIKRTELMINVSLGAYLKRSVVNTALNVLQQQRTVPLDESTSAEQFPSVRSPEEEKEFSELQMVADTAIRQLPDRTRLVFQLIRFEGCSYREVAAQLAISEKAVEKEMMKALRLLREALKDYLVVLIYLKIFL